jgi:hypothetical protein
MAGGDPRVSREVARSPSDLCLTRQDQAGSPCAHSIRLSCLVVKMGPLGFAYSGVLTYNGCAYC